jgi:hypothetical protein
MRHKRDKQASERGKASKRRDNRKQRESEQESDKKCKIEIFSQHIVAPYLQSMLCCEHIKRRAYLWTSLFCMFWRTRRIVESNVK